MGIAIDLFFLVQAENDLLLLWRSIGLVFVWVVEIELAFVWGRKSLSFSVSFVLVWVIEIDLVSIWGIERDLISV